MAQRASALNLEVHGSLKVSGYPGGLRLQYIDSM
jgi:hypothetical protein